MKTETCRMCKGTNLEEWLDLGMHPHSDQFHKEKEPEMRYPLGVSVCHDCGLNQLTWVVAKEELYLKDYLYESSITKTANEHWTEFAETVSKNIGLKGGFVVDIGSNDGTLLSKFQALGSKVMGIDPTPEATQLAIDRGVPTLQEFFTEDAVIKYMIREAEKAHGPLRDQQADLITGTNVFAHVHDLDDFMKGVDRLMKRKGTFVFESPYFGEFLKGVEADTVYHQHLSYLSLRPLVPFLERHGMEVFNVEQRPLHGGVFRVYIGRVGDHIVSKTVQEMLDGETWTLADLWDFAKKFETEMNLLLEFLIDVKKMGKTVAVVSTPAKGNTLLNYSGIGRFIDFATDKSKLKQGRYTPGTFLKVESDEALIERQPDYAIILAWNFAKEIMANNKQYKGKWIVPLPRLKVYESAQR